MSTPHSDPHKFLRAAISTKNVVLVAGTGVSMSATYDPRTGSSHPQASWKGLLDHGFEKVEREKGYKKAQVYRELLDKDAKVGDFLAAATALTEALKIADIYEDWLAETIGSIRPINRDIIDSLHELRNAGYVLLATTNYDDVLLDNYPELKPVTWKDRDTFISTQRERRVDTVLYLHGHWKDPDSVILSQNSYNSITRDEAYREALGAVWITTTWVYVACGENGLSDPDFSLLFNQHGKRARKADQWDFCLVEEKDYESFNAFFIKEQLNIVAVPYGNEKSMLPAYLRSLSPSLLKGYANTVKSKSEKELKRPLYSKDHSSNSSIDLPLGNGLTSTTTNMRAQSVNSSDGEQQKEDSSPISEIQGEIQSAYPTAASKVETPKSRIRDFLVPGSRTTIIGDPGCGKSTLLESVAYFYASKYASNNALFMEQECENMKLPEKAWLPILIRCGDHDWRDESLLDSYENLFMRHFLRLAYDHSESSQLFKEVKSLLYKGQVLLLVDGIDEIRPDVNRQKFAKLLSNIACNYNYKDTPIIVTTRIEGFAGAEKEMESHFERTYVAPLPNETKIEIVERWAVQKKWDAARKESMISLVCDKERISDLANKILFLSLIVQNPDENSPKDEKEVLYNAIKWMMDKKHLQVEPPVEDNELLPHLDYLAYKMHRDKSNDVLESAAVLAFDELRVTKRADIIEPRSTANLLGLCVDLIGILRTDGFQIERAMRYRVLKFIHPIFQDHFLQRYGDCYPNEAMEILFSTR